MSENLNPTPAPEPQPVEMVQPTPNVEPNVADTPQAGDNSNGLKDIIVQSAKDMAEIDAQRKSLNRQAADIREVLVDNGIDKEAFKEAYSYFKKRRHERDGYDDSSKLCHDALAGQGDLFDVLADKA